MLYVQKNSARHVHVTFWAASGFVNIIYVLFELWVCGLRLDHVLIWHGYLFGCEQSFSTELPKLWYLAILGLLLTLPLYAWSASSSLALLLACRFRDPPASCIHLDPDWLSLRPRAVTWPGIIGPARFTGRPIAVALSQLEGLYLWWSLEKLRCFGNKDEAWLAQLCKVLTVSEGSS